MFVNGALSSLEVILPDVPSDHLQQLIAGTNSLLLDDMDVTISDEVLNAIVLSLRKVYVELDKLPKF